MMRSLTFVYAHGVREAGTPIIELVKGIGRRIQWNEYNYFEKVSIDQRDVISSRNGFWQVLSQGGIVIQYSNEV